MIKIKFTSGGIVAEKRPTCTSPGIKANISFIYSSNPRPSILSASSITKSFNPLVFKNSLFIISNTLPGVPKSNFNQIF